MSKAKVKICSWCNKPIELKGGERKRAPQAIMHLVCAEEKERQNSLRRMNKLRLPERKNDVLKKIDKYGVGEEIAERTKEKISEDLEEKPEEEIYNLCPSIIENILPTWMKNERKNFNRILDKKIERIVNKKVEEKFQELKEELRKSNPIMPFGY